MSQTYAPSIRIIIPDSLERGRIQEPHLSAYIRSIHILYVAVDIHVHVLELDVASIGTRQRNQASIVTTIRIRPWSVSLYSSSTDNNVNVYGTGIPVKDEEGVRKLGDRKKSRRGNTGT